MRRVFEEKPRKRLPFNKTQTQLCEWYQPLIIMFIVQEMKAQVSEVTRPWQNECQKNGTKLELFIVWIQSWLLSAVAIGFTYQLGFWKCESNLLIENRKLSSLDNYQIETKSTFKKQNKKKLILETFQLKKERWRNSSVSRTWNSPLESIS